MVGRNENLRGCLLGLAVGDAMGYSVDKKSWEEICEAYGPNGLLGYDLANGSADVTSYTQLAAFVCNGILLAETRRNTALYGRFITMSVLEWAKSQQFRTKPERTNCWVAQVSAMRRRHCMDTRMLDALSRPVLGTPEKPVFSSDTPGALTTAIAIGLCYDPEKMAKDQIGRLATEAAALTHGEPLSMLCSAFLAYSIAYILQEPDKHLSRHFAAACDAITDQFAVRYPQAVELLCKKVDYALSLTRDPELTPFAAMTLLECTTAAGCIAGAVYASTVHSGNFDEAMITSVNHSGRSGAVGAVTGAILGARLGAETLPEFYLECLEPIDTLEELANDLTAGRQVSNIFDDSWDQKYVQGMPVS